MASLTLSDASPTLSFTLPVARSTLPSFLSDLSSVMSPAASFTRPLASSTLPSSDMEVLHSLVVGMGCPGTCRSMPPRLPATLDALLDAGAALISRSASGRIALARAAPVIHRDALPKVMTRLPDVLDTAYAEAAQPLDAKHVKKSLG